MKIKNRRNFVASIICTLLAIVVLVLYILAKENRLIVSFVLLIAMSIFNFKISVSKNGMFERIREFSNERDQYVTMKSSHLLVGFMNYAFEGLIFAFAVAYGIWKSFYFLVVLYTLGGVLVFMFVSYLVINIYVDRHE